MELGKQRNGTRKWCSRRASVPWSRSLLRVEWDKQTKKGGAMFAPDIVGLSRVGYADYASRGFTSFVRLTRKVKRCEDCKKRKRSKEHSCAKSSRKRRYR